jgi:hypothetical protein
MSPSDHAPSASTDKGYEEDVNSKDLVTVGIYFVVLTSMFFACLMGLFMYFRWEADNELNTKVLSERIDMRDARKADAEKYKAVGATIDASMKRTVEEWQARNKQ